MYGAHFLQFLKVQILLCSILQSTSIRIKTPTGKLESRKTLRPMEWFHVIRNIIFICSMLIFSHRWSQLAKWEQIIGYTGLFTFLWCSVIRFIFIWDLPKYLATVNGIINFETNNLKKGNKTLTFLKHFTVTNVHRVSKSISITVMSKAGIRIPKVDHRQAAILLIGIVTTILQPPSFFILLIESPCMPPFLGSIFFVSTSGECTLPRGTLEIFYRVFVLIYLWDMLLEWLVAQLSFWFAVNFSFTNYIRIVHR
jgi:hypothetical protein